LCSSEVGAAVYMPRRVSLATRFATLKRDNFTCVYCGRRPPDVQLHVDHARSIAAGGSNDGDNLVAACEGCNQGKGSGSEDSRAEIAAEPPGAGLRGLYFHTFRDGLVVFQGRVERLDAGLVVVRLYSFVTGESHCLKAWPLSALTAPDSISFYATDSEMRAAYELLCANRRG
jgi:hypothetical protein